MSDKPTLNKIETVSRRRFLLTGAATLGAVAAAELPVLGQQNSSAVNSSASGAQRNPKGKVLHIIAY